MIIIKEIFKTINYKGTDVTVSNKGTVYWNNTKRNWFYNTDGYTAISLKIPSDNNTDGDWRSVGVYILVATAFIPNPNNLPEVNHKDFNRKNPNVDNLEWISRKDNVRYSLCNKPDVSGSNNPNFGNHILSEKYRNNKELSKQKQSRKGIQNGRATKIDLYYDNQYINSFDYIGLCCKYLIDIGATNSKNIDSVRGRIDGCIRKGIKYKKHYSFVKR